MESGDIFAWGFLLLLFGLLFGLPIWLILKHHRKSKVQREVSKRYQESETPLQAFERQRKHNTSIANTISFTAGLLFGARILGNLLVGVAIGLCMALIAMFIIDRIYRNKKLTFDAKLTRRGNGEVVAGPIKAKAFLEALDSGKDIEVAPSNRKAK